MNQMSKLLRQAQKMQQKVSLLKKELEVRELKCSIGGGAVKITINGKQEILDLKIDQKAWDMTDQSSMEELLLTATNQAIKESKEMVSTAMKKVTGGLDLPGL